MLYQNQVRLLSLISTMVYGTRAAVAQLEPRSFHLGAAGRFQDHLSQISARGRAVFKGGVEVLWTLSLESSTLGRRRQHPLVANSGT